jgi:CheY-like chemotaxis protein
MPKIVLIEQESGLTKWLIEVFENHRFNVSFFQNGLEAYQYCLRTPPRVILTDLDVPKLNGMQLLKRLKENPLLKEIPVIFLAKELEVEERIKSMSSGIDDYIYKPYIPEEVVARVDCIIQEVETIDQAMHDSKHGFSGNLAEMNLVDLIQTLDLGEKSGVINMLHDDEKGLVCFDKGKVIDAHLDGFDSEGALTTMLTWLDGSFYVTLEESQHERVLNKSNRDILLLGTKLIQEWRELAGQMPPFDSAIIASNGADYDSLTSIEKRVLSVFQSPVRIKRGISLCKLDVLTSLRLIKKFLNNGWLVAAPTAGMENADGNEMMDRVKEIKESSHSLHSRIASFFKRRAQTDFESENPSQRDLKEHLTDEKKNPSGRNHQIRLPHKVYLSRGDLLLIRQQLLGE